ncbi:Nitrogen assimilation regulatory protein [Budvicia aquatica]|uniref:Nitrogen assimilation regulatory protein n=1 Tax=Budvicia aquatica TaxID=82979 RepID=A0A484ZE69_9GAMM|nr:Nitrogen assimilation regulatory protein [Budvicia aquatica]
MKKSYRILIVDDEENVRRMLTAAFTLDGHQPICAADGQQALEVFGQQKPDIVLMDIRMPRLGGMEALQVMRKTHQEIPVILMTAYAAVETAVEALRFGAFDYVIKPFDLDELKLLINRALQLRSMKQEINLLHRELSDSYQWDRILTNSTKMMELCRDTAKIAQSNASVLITGESGTGKELIAKAIHYNSARAKGRLLKSTVVPYPSRFWKVNFLVTKKGHLPAHKCSVRGYLNELIKVLYCLMKWEKCPITYRLSCCGCYRRENLNAWEAAKRSKQISASSPPLIAI